MKRTYIAGAITWGLLVIVCIIAACCESMINSSNNTSYQKETYTDSIKHSAIDSVVAVYSSKIEQLNNTIDSMRNIPVKHDTIYIEDNEALMVANYKLERISYYNRIAGKKNNIKFLRGWINRVLNEK